MNPTQSQASEFYNSLPKDDKEAFTYLSSFVDTENQEKEQEWIEYKTGHYEKDKVLEHWSKHLSGFANSGDGVIIWGIQTKEKHKYDFPSSIVLVEKPEEFKGQLEQARRHLVDPPLRGVEIRHIAGENGRGFVVAYVPESPIKPHQAKHPKCENNYYFRNGHNTEPVKQSLLRILFYPRFYPLLELTLAETGSRTAVHLRLRNVGPVTVSELFVVVIDELGHVVLDLNEENFNSVATTFTTVNASCKESIHPRMSTTIGTLTLFPGSEIYVSAFAKDMNPFKWKLEESPEGVLRPRILQE